MYANQSIYFYSILTYQSPHNFFAPLFSVGIQLLRVTLYIVHMTGLKYPFPLN